jgi:xanthine dehydrogenase accessory factor
MLRGELADHVQRLVAERTPFVLATVVRARHPTSVRPGYCAVVLADGTIDGFVGGVCAESSVRLYSLRALETGDPILLRLVPGDGTEEASAEHGDLVGEAVVERNPCLSGGALEIFLEPQVPASRVVIVGGSPIAEALERLSTAAGYDVARVRTGDEVHPEADDFAVIVASHGAAEEQVLAEALRAGVPYVALVASEVRGTDVRAALDVPDPLRAQLHTPAGLAIGARTPDEIAISILAEVVSERHAHPIAPLADPPVVAIDPVCGMEVAAAPGSPYLEVDGEKVFFCGEHCRQAYAKEHVVG